MHDAVRCVISDQGVVTPGVAVAINAEKVVRANADAELMDAIGRARFCYADGMPIAWTLSRKGAANVRIAGCDLWVALMKEAGRRGTPVFLLGATRQVHQATESKLRETFGTNIVDSEHGYFDDDDAMVERIVRSGAQIVTVAMGSPRQEHLIRKFQSRYGEAFYMGVGGSYDLLVGASRRAPRWMQDVGLEWLYRLLKQPSRLRRQGALLKYLLMHVRGQL
jgi:UDP-N-acetyl-D-mannosaminouronate:lipid I N-acetyl-D-mannosaminouronosyltransferase